MHGYAISQYIQATSKDVIRVQEGSLYPALQRLRQKSFVRPEWRMTANNQRARFYTITADGRKQLGEEQAGFAELMTAVQRILRPA